MSKSTRSTSTASKQSTSRRPSPRARAAKCAGPTAAPSPFALAVSALASATEHLAELPYFARLLRAVVALLSRPATVDAVGVVDAIAFAAIQLEKQARAEASPDPDEAASTDFVALFEDVSAAAAVAARVRPDSIAEERAKVDTARAVLAAVRDMMAEPWPDRAEEKRALLVRVVADRASERAA